MNDLTQDRLKELLHYDPETGIFTRNIRRSSAIRGAIAGTEDNYGYLHVVVDYRRYKCHRLAWLYITGEWPVGEIDHINLRPDDNRWGNLRTVTHQQNSFNHRMRRTNSTGYIGVYFDRKRKKYFSTVTELGKTRALGRFDTAEEASRAFQSAIAHRGDFRPAP